MDSKIKIYIASPLGFAEIGQRFHEKELIPLIEQIGYGVLDPWNLTPKDKIEEVRAMSYGIDRKNAWKRLNREIGENNKNAIDQSDGLLAILDGTDVDSGTAAEIGYAFAKGKPILGYRCDFRLSSDNEGGVINLQVEYFIHASGGTIVTEIGKLSEELKRVFG